MKWHISIFFLLLSTLLFTGCLGNNNTIEEVNYYTGDEGFTLEFLENSPPKQMYSGQLYPLSLFIDNEGAFSVISYNGNKIDYRGTPYNELEDLHAQLSISYDPFYFTQTPAGTVASSAVDNIHAYGKSLYWPEGQQLLVTGDILKVNELSQRTGASTVISASLCYPYQTLLTTEVCIDVSPFVDNEKDNFCSSEELSFTDQGAPIAITSVDVQTMPVSTEMVTTTVYDTERDQEGNIVMIARTEESYQTKVKPLIRMTIEHVGNGQLIRARAFGEQESCIKDEETDADPYTVGVRAFIGSTQLVCTPEIPILYSGEAEITCGFAAEDDITSASNTLEILQVELSYVYKTEASIEVEIRDEGNRGSSIPAMVTDYSCSDFNRDPTGCRVYSEDSARYRESDGSIMNCYYCPLTGACLDSNCDDCKDGNTAAYIEDIATRKCFGDCSTTKPVVGLKGDTDVTTPTYTLTCTPPKDVTSETVSRCGCKEFYYWLGKNASACTSMPSTATTLQPSIITGTTASVAVDGASALTKAYGKAEHDVYLCYAAKASTLSDFRGKKIYTYNG